MVIDDTAETGRTTGVEVLDSDTAFFMSYTDFGNSSVMKFNPSTGVISERRFGGIGGVDVRDISIGPEGNLWVGIGDAQDPRIVILDPATGTRVGGHLTTSMIPAGIHFIR